MAGALGEGEQPYCGLVGLALAVAQGHPREHQGHEEDRPDRCV